MYPSYWAGRAGGITDQSGHPPSNAPPRIKTRPDNVHCTLQTLPRTFWLDWIKFGFNEIPNSPNRLLPCDQAELPPTIPFSPVDLPFLSCTPMLSIIPWTNYSNTPAIFLRWLWSLHLRMHLMWVWFNTEDPPPWLLITHNEYSIDFSRNFP